MTNHLFGVENLEACEHFAYVAGFEHLLTRHCDCGFFALGIFYYLFEVDFLKIKDYVCNILLNTGNCVELMLYSVYAD